MATVSDELVTWLRARLDEDERAARSCAAIYPPPWNTSDRGWMATVRADEPDFRVVTELEQWHGQPEDAWLGDFIEHIARHDPQRVLAEIDAKRRIIDRSSLYAQDLLKLLALPYADQPGWREEWRP
jgi:hypothetical protein